MTDLQNPLEISGVCVVRQVVHRKFRSAVDFEGFTYHLERMLRRFDASVLSMMARSPNPARPQGLGIADEEALMILQTIDHGSALTVIGRHAKIKQYWIGNPTISMAMTHADLATAFYASVSVLIYEGADGDCVVEYDQPSSQLEQFPDSGVRSLGLSLDRRLSAVLQRAAQLATN